MHKIALVAGALLLQTVVAHAEEARIKLPPEQARLLQQGWHQDFRQMVVLLRRLHEPGERATWLQKRIYQDIIDAVLNQGLEFDDLGITNDELKALVFGGDIV